MKICEIHGIPVSDGLCADCEEEAEAELERSERDDWDNLWRNLFDD